MNILSVSVYKVRKASHFCFSFALLCFPTLFRSLSPTFVFLPDLFFSLSSVPLSLLLLFWLSSSFPLPFFLSFGFADVGFFRSPLRFLFASFVFFSLGFFLPASSLTCVFVSSFCFPLRSSASLSLCFPTLLRFPLTSRFDFSLLLVFVLPFVPVPTFVFPFPLGFHSAFASFLPFCFSQLSLLWWRWRESNPWPPACRAGALPAELHPHSWDTVPENRTTNRYFTKLCLVGFVFFVSYEWSYFNLSCSP